MENQEFFFGVDVSKATLDIAVMKEGEIVLERQIENKIKSIRKFFRECKKSLAIKSEQIIACMEHTGIYNYILLDELYKMKVRTCLEPALQIKQSQGMTRGKNDQVDARRIASYAFKNRLELKFWRPQRSILQKVQALLSLRDRLIKTRVQLQTPLQEAVGYLDPEVVKSLKSSAKTTLKAIDRDLEHLENEINELIRKDDNLTNQFKQATSVPGVGKITALNMIVVTGEFDRIKSPKQFACYSGVAPFEHQSGTSIRGRSRVSKMANMTMKKLLHLAAMSAIQCCQEMKAYYLRKVAEGKNKMAVINAVRNKLITRVYACIRQRKLFQINYQNALA
jgi:transposase